MKRFEQLEFDEKGSAKGETASGEPIRDAAYFHNQAQNYWLGGDFELALRNYSRALEKNNALFEGWSGQVWMLIELGEYPEAILWADKALEMFPEHPELLAAKAVACVRDARLDKAQAYSDNSISKENITPRVWLARAEVLLERKSSMAQDCVSNAVSIAGPNAPVIRLEAGRLLYRKGDFSSALEYLRQAVIEMPKSALAWLEFGLCQRKLRFPEAAQAFKQASTLRPHWDLAQAALERMEKRGLIHRIFRK